MVKMVQLRILILGDIGESLKLEMSVENGDQFGDDEGDEINEDQGNNHGTMGDDGMSEIQSEGGFGSNESNSNSSSDDSNSDDDDDLPDTIVHRYSLRNQGGENILQNLKSQNEGLRAGQKLARELKRLETHSKILGTDDTDDSNDEGDKNKLETREEIADLGLDEMAMINVVESSTRKESQIPRGFQQAWWWQDEEVREKWRNAVRKEFHEMIKRGVWRRTKKTEVPRNRRLVGHRWVFTIKRDGRYRARLVALGYSQIPGLDFMENFAPVASDVTFRILLTVLLSNPEYTATCIDVTTAFLYGEIGRRNIYDASTRVHREYRRSNRGGRLCRASKTNLWARTVGQTILEEICGGT